MPLKTLSSFFIGLLLITGCSAGSDNTTRIYFVTDTPRGFKLVSEIREVKDEERAIKELLAGKLQPLDPDYQNLWSDSDLKSIRIIEDLAVVDMSLGSLNVGAEGELEKGEYRFKVEEFSAEDGSLFAQDDKVFRVR